jgi:hypothetical protein
MGNLRKRWIRTRRAAVQWRLRAVPVGRAVLRGTLNLGRPQPKVSAVVVARNDGYFRDYAERMRATISWNHKHLADEVVLVEWNPPDGAPLFATRFVREFPFLRAFVVPAHIHRGFAGAAPLGMLDYLAKNVGIRRATGEYVLVTNVDIFIEPRAAFIRYMLNPQFVFRTRRVDFEWDGQLPSRDILWDRCRHRPGPPGWRENMFHGSGDFTLAHRALWQRARGYDESMPLQRMHADSRGLLQLQAHGGVVVLWGYHYHTYHASSSTAIGGPAALNPFDFKANLPYRNPETWGLGLYTETPLAERVWLLAQPDDKL